MSRITVSSFTEDINPIAVAEILKGYMINEFQKNNNIANFVEAEMIFFGVEEGTNLEMFLKKREQFNDFLVGLVKRKGVGPYLPNLFQRVSEGLESIMEIEQEMVLNGMASYEQFNLYNIVQESCVAENIWEYMRGAFPFFVGAELDPENPRYSVHPDNDAYDYHI